MSPRCRNLFLLFGLGAIIVMLCTMEVDYHQILDNLARAGLFFPAVIGVWVFVYALNSFAYRTIINCVSEGKCYIPYKKAYKLTVSGFAFSYISPFGFAGGPYRAMELKPYLGLRKSMSTVVLYAMMHILSHICFWTTAAVLFAVFYFEKMTPWLWTLFAVFAVIVPVVLFIFYIFYKRGVIERLFRPLCHIPLLKRWASPFYERHAEDMQMIDQSISLLHASPRSFYTSLACEYLARVVNSFEFYFILLSLGVNLTFCDAVIVLAFSSLIGNLLFFLPMQLGAREGGLMIIVGILGISAGGIGVLSSLYSRLRELTWILIGVSLVKVGNKNLMRPLNEQEE